VSFLGTIALVVTLSRAAWISFVFFVTVVVFLYPKRTSGKTSSRLGTILFLTLGLGIIFLFFYDLIIVRFALDEADSVASRFLMNQAAISMIKAHPFVGIGINNYTEVLLQYDTTGFSSVFFQPVHNLYLLIASEIGIIGLMIFLWLICSIFREGLSCLKTKSILRSTIMIGLLAGLGAHLIHCLFDAGFRVSEALTILFYLLIGMVVALARIEKEDTKADDRVQTSALTANA
jgi:O-antigen ligase